MTIPIAIHQRLIRQLLYSEIFRHPLTINELADYSGQALESVRQAITELQEHGLISEKNGYYFVFDEEDKVERRLHGMRKADELRAKALKVGKLIQCFPFVQGVAISGSLSKGILHDDGDFDYFIITQKHRLWIARTLLVFYKKIFLLNSRKYFCVNYFIDDTSLEIAEKNVFTATEIVTLIPVAGTIFPEFYACNQWTRNFFSAENKTVHFPNPSKPYFSRFVMWLFKGKMGERFDRWCMKRTLHRWRKKFTDFDEEKFDLTLKSRPYVSKHHPNDFQTKVLNRYTELTNAFKEHQKTALESAGIVL